MTRINNLTINEITAGDEGAPPVVMLHGWGAKIELIWPLAEALSPIGYKVYALDLPGFGRSEPPPQPWTIYNYARFVVDYLNHHKLGQVHLFGHSFGGRLGLILGADYSNRLGAMALADAAGIRTPSSLMTRTRTTVYKSIRDGLKIFGLHKVSDTLRDRYNRRYGSTDFQSATGVMRQTFIQVVNEDLRDYAARVAVPTLLIWGDRDEDTPLWQGQLLEKLIPDAGLVIYPGVGHYSYLAHPQQTARTIHELFRIRKISDFEGKLGKIR